MSHRLPCSHAVWSLVLDGNLLNLVKVWEAMEILRAQSKTIMSLDEVQLQETSTGRSVRSGHSAGGASTSRSPTNSIAQSRLSSRDDSIRVSDSRIMSAL